MRKPLIAGNWKMHGSKSMTKDLVSAIAVQTKDYANIEILVCPPFPYLALASEISTHLNVGAQNVYYADKGAYTGEVSASMLLDTGCGYVLIGHSERRTLFAENDSLIAKKTLAALTAGLKVILCLGETLEQREAGQTEAIVTEQLNAVCKALPRHLFDQLVIAYEPVWAIGTGLTATAEQAQAVHKHLRDVISQINVDLGKTIRILYGGSMKAENAAALLAMPDIDGGLIGGASLDATSFSAICRAAHDLSLAAVN